MSISVVKESTERIFLMMIGILLLIYLPINIISIICFPGFHREFLAISCFFYILTGILILIIFKKKQNHIQCLTQNIEELTEENRKLNWDLNKAIFEILALFEFTNILGNDSEFDPMIELMVDTIKRILDYDGCCLFFYNEKCQEVSVKVNRGFPIELTNVKFTSTQFLTGHIIKSGQALLINDLDQESGKLGMDEFKHLIGDFKSFIGVPLLFQNKVIGILLIAKKSAFALKQEDLRLLFVIANQAALAIQNMRLYEKAYFSSITDGLTGVYNHKYFREYLEMQLIAAKKIQSFVSLILLDIDNFKRFNDNYGHLVGDSVLKEVAQLIQLCIPPESMVARYGGEEFVILMPGSSIETANNIAEKIRMTIANHIFVTNEHQSLKVTVSLGFATYPNHIKNMERMVEELIDKADENLYSAKNSGRNRVCCINT